MDAPLLFRMVIADGDIIRKPGHLVQLTFIPEPPTEPEPVPFKPELFDKGIPTRR